MKRFLLIVQGNDSFSHEQEIIADTIEIALLKAQIELTSLVKLTIEQFISVTVAELTRKT